MTKVTLKKTKPGQKTISFNKGGLHRSTNTPAGKTIPKAKIKEALSGSLGPKAKKQAQFAKNVLKGK